MNVREIIDKKKKGEISFHLRIENEMFDDILVNFQENRFIASATIAFVLYEKIFITRLLREIAYPDDFIASKENTKEQFDYLINKESEIVDGKNKSKKRGMSFQDITKELEEKCVISEEEKRTHDSFYNKYRIPVLHGLTYRLYESIFGIKPKNFLEIDVKYEEIYNRLSEIIIKKIYMLIWTGKLIKR